MTELRSMKKPRELDFRAKGEMELDADLHPVSLEMVFRHLVATIPGGKKVGTMTVYSEITGTVSAEALSEEDEEALPAAWLPEMRRLGVIEGSAYRSRTREKFWTRLWEVWEQAASEARREAIEDEDLDRAHMAAESAPSKFIRGG